MVGFHHQVEPRNKMAHNSPDIKKAHESVLMVLKKEAVSVEFCSGLQEVCEVNED